MRRRKPDSRRGEGNRGNGGADGAALEDGAGLDEAGCRERAVALLARREHSRGELARKLAARGYTEPVIAASLARLEHEGALADDRFTASFSRTRAAKGKGPARIRAELAERGIEKDDARARLAGAEIDWAAEAIAVRLKRFGPEPPRDFKERARQARFLQYRGFEQRHIEAAFASTADDAS